MPAHAATAQDHRNPRIPSRITRNAPRRQEINIYSSFSSLVSSSSASEAFEETLRRTARRGSANRPSSGGTRGSRGNKRQGLVDVAATNPNVKSARNAGG